MSRLVLLDNEAVQALRDPAHPKHRKVVSHVQVVATRKRRAESIDLAVPTAVRVEAGWNRTSPAWAFPNMLRIADSPLDAAAANDAADICSGAGVSVADAHLGAVMQSASADQITVITSDLRDMRRVAGDANVTVVVI
jgi:predicted nucleic acid-binding protein